MLYAYLGQPLPQKRRRDAGNWLRALRERRGLSQRELARRVGISYYTLIAQLEHGRGRIPSSQYLVWAQALGIEPDEFIRGLNPSSDRQKSEVAGCNSGD
jgi:transcriptional regulator with XRE-family HTH domain